MSQKIRIKLKSYDHNLVDKSADKIVKTVKTTGAVVTGPIPLPTHKKIFTVLRSPHVNKKSREQFKLCSYKRLLDGLIRVEQLDSLLGGKFRHPRRRLAEIGHDGHVACVDVPGHVEQESSLLTWVNQHPLVLVDG